MDTPQMVAIPKWAANVGAFVLLLFIPWMTYTSMTLETLKAEIKYVSPIVQQFAVLNREVGRLEAKVEALHAQTNRLHPQRPGNGKP
jgi:ABC-type uncharacterized transport system permease subunit